MRLPAVLFFCLLLSGATGLNEHGSASLSEGFDLDQKSAFDLATESDHQHPAVYVRTGKAVKGTLEQYKKLTSDDAYVFEHLVHYRFDPEFFSHRRTVQQYTSSAQKLTLEMVPFIYHYFDLVFSRRMKVAEVPLHMRTVRNASALMEYMIESADIRLVYVSLHDWRLDREGQTSLRGIDTFMLLPSLQGGRCRALVLDGADVPHLSQGAVHYQLRMLFDSKKVTHIFFGPKDIHSKYVHSHVTGFTFYYLTNLGTSNVVRHMKISEYVHSNRKNALVTTSWGMEWPELDGRIEDRKALQQWVIQQQTISANKKPREREWISRNMYEPRDYLDKLAEHVFFLSPLGQGVLSAKLYESIMVGTVPIATKVPALEDLRDAGLPVILIDDWRQLSRELLQQWNQTIRFADGSYRFDWKLAKAMLTVEHSLSVFRGETGTDPEAASRAELFRSISDGLASTSASSKRKSRFTFRSSYSQPGLYSPMKSDNHSNTLKHMHGTDLSRGNGKSGRMPRKKSKSIFGFIVD